MTKWQRSYYGPSASDEATATVHVIWCERDDCECFEPACRAHGCMAKSAADGETGDEK